VGPCSRRDTVLGAFGRQPVELGRIAAAAGDMTRARGAYCDVASKLVSLAGDLKPRPRLRQLALESQFICLEARYFSGERDGIETSLAALAERVDAVVPLDDGLQADWGPFRAPAPAPPSPHPPISPTLTRPRP